MVTSTVPSKSRSEPVSSTNRISQARYSVKVRSCSSNLEATLASIWSETTSSATTWAVSGMSASTAFTVIIASPTCAVPSNWSFSNTPDPPSSSASTTNALALALSQIVTVLYALPFSSPFHAMESSSRNCSSSTLMISDPSSALEPVAVAGSSGSTVTSGISLSSGSASAPSLD